MCIRNIRLFADWELKFHVCSMNCDWFFELFRCWTLLKDIDCARVLCSRKKVERIFHESFKSTEENNVDCEALHGVISLIICWWNSFRIAEFLHGLVIKTAKHFKLFASYPVEIKKSNCQTITDWRDSIKITLRIRWCISIRKHFISLQVLTICQLSIIIKHTFDGDWLTRLVNHQTNWWKWFARMRYFWKKT